MKVNLRKASLILMMVGAIAGCQSKRSEVSQNTMPAERQYKLERVGRVNAVQIYADGFDQLSLKEKIFAYYLYQAALAGRDIAIDQHQASALEVRELFETLYAHPQQVDPAVMQKITTYLKLFWINNGAYDAITSKKFVPECSFEEFKQACMVASSQGARFDLREKETLPQKLDRLKKVIFDATFEPMLTNKTPGEDWIKQSAVNFYDHGLTLNEVQAWAKRGGEKYPLNSFVGRENGKIVEKVWRAGGAGAAPGIYAAGMTAVIKYLEQAIPYASSEHQAETVRKLVKYLRSGDPEDFRQYNIQWVKDSSNVDFILGYIEVYLDPRGQKGEWEASVFYTDPAQTKLMRNLASYAQYFEDKAPWAAPYKKKIDQVPLANVINVIAGTGGTGPVSPIGINLPNDQATRQQYGTKSVLLNNVTVAAEKAQGRELLREFAWDQAEIDRNEKFGTVAENLHTAMHEVIGHGSGKVSDKLKGKDPSEFFPGYYNTLEETRADLVADWNCLDEKLVDIGVAKDAQEVQEIGRVLLDNQIRSPKCGALANRTR
jgi:dipeptidyl-peptidase-3